MSLSFTKCPVCGAHSFETDAPLAPRNSSRVRYDFSKLTPGDSFIIQLNQVAAWSRIQKWRTKKSFPERASWRFTTRKISNNETLIRRTA